MFSRASATLRPVSSEAAMVVTPEAMVDGKAAVADGKVAAAADNKLKLSK